VTAGAATTPKVSAIIIVLNGDAYIEEAIASIRGQSFGDWELLVVDDGSTDGTKAIVARLADTDSRIRLLQHPDGGNHGMSAARNVGIAAARGAYIGFLDADDLWLPEKLAEQVAILEADPALGMVYGRTRIWHGEKGQPSPRDFFYDLGVTPDRTYQPPRLFLNLLRNRYQTPTTCNALMRREAVHAVGGFEPEFRAMFEDQLFFAKLLASFPVHVSGRCWAWYRQHDQASSALETDAERIAHDQARYLRATERYVGRVFGSLSRERMAVRRQLMLVRGTIAKLALKRRVKQVAGR
jgi:glycosyltransferase involved in cell wall biosynthesis